VIIREAGTVEGSKVALDRCVVRRQNADASPRAEWTEVVEKKAVMTERTQQYPATSHVTQVLCESISARGFQNNATSVIRNACSMVAGAIIAGDSVVVRRAEIYPSFVKISAGVVDNSAIIGWDHVYSIFRVRAGVVVQRQVSRVKDCHTVPRIGVTDIVDQNPVRDIEDKDPNFRCSMDVTILNCEKWGRIADEYSGFIASTVDLQTAYEIWIGLTAIAGPSLADKIRVAVYHYRCVRSIRLRQDGNPWICSSISCWSSRIRVTKWNQIRPKHRERK
jgi:hypothetical protein